MIPSSPNFHYLRRRLMGGEPSGPQGTAAARRPVIAGSVAAMAATTPAPTLAQGVYVGPGGVSVDVGRPRYREHDRLWQELVVGIVGWQDILLPTWTYLVLTALLFLVPLQKLQVSGATRARVAVISGLVVLSYVMLMYLIFYLTYTPLDVDHVRGVRDVTL
jgi:hypothetical protein